MSVRLALLSRASDIPPVGETLGQRARLIIAQRDGTPVLPSNQITMGSRLVGGANAGAMDVSIRREVPVSAAVIAEHAVALPRGVSVSTTVRSDAGERLPALTITLSRDDSDDSSLELAVTLSNRLTIIDESDDDPSDIRDDLPAAPARTALKRETVVVPLDRNDSHWVVLMPVAFDVEAGHSLAVLVTVAPGSDDPAHLALAEETTRLLATTALEASKPRIDPAAVAARSSVESALTIAQDPRRIRAAMVVLTTANPAPIAADLVAAGDDELLTQFSTRLAEQLPGLPTDLAPEQWGLVVDLVALGLMSELQSNNKAPPEVESVLAIHTGEAGRNAGSIEDLIKGVARRADLETRIVAENFIYLEDNSPAARTRAFDWLVARGLAPSGYDPLADARARRAALEAALTASSQPAQP